jgi:hypothetical protein
MWTMVCVGLITGACGSEAPGVEGDAGPFIPGDAQAPHDATAAVDRGAEPDYGPGTVGGTYVVEGAWDLSAPIGGDRTVGTVVAELIVEETVSASGVPGALEGALATALEESAAPGIRSWVDGRMPPELRPGSAFLEALGEAAAEVRYRGALDLETDGDLVHGVEQIDALAVERDGRLHEIAVADLPVPTDTVSLESEWNGAQIDDRIELEPYTVELHYGAVILWIAAEVLGTDVEALEAELASSLVCTPLVDEITGGGDAIQIDLGLTNVDIPASDLRNACESAVGSVMARALGLFSFDAPLELDGSVRTRDTTGDGSTNVIESTDEHGGVVLIGGSRALAPRVAIRMTARR